MTFKPSPEEWFEWADTAPKDFEMAMVSVVEHLHFDDERQMSRNLISRMWLRIVNSSKAGLSQRVYLEVAKLKQFFY